MSNAAPIGVFDSGMGGLTVVREMISQLPNESFAVPLNTIAEIKSNRVPIRGYRAFHIKLQNGRNYNLVPRINPDMVVTAIGQLVHQ